MDKAPKRVLVVGEINIDLICQGYHAFPSPGREVLVDDFRMVLGSASAICAMGLARLGTPVAFFGKVGDDPAGHFCLDAMRAPRDRPRGGRRGSRTEDGRDGRDHLHASIARSSRSWDRSRR